VVGEGANGRVLALMLHAIAARLPRASVPPIPYCHILHVAFYLF